MNRDHLTRRMAATVAAAAVLVAGLTAGPIPESTAAAPLTQASTHLTLSAKLPTAVASAKKPSRAANKTFQSFTAAGVTSKYHVYAAGVNKIKGILFYLDGDGQWAFDHPTSSYALGGSSGIVAQARKRGLITVAVRTPDRRGAHTWWENGARNGAYFDALKRKIHAEYPQAKSKWLAGYSGGAQFITQSYLPQYPASTGRRGGAILLGGGGVPELRVKGFAKKDAAAFRMRWYTGAADTAANSNEGYDALGEAKKGRAWYAKRGFPTAARYPARVDHDLTGRFGGAIVAAMDR